MWDPQDLITLQASSACYKRITLLLLSWLKHYATSLKGAGSRTDEVNEFFSIYLILPAALGPGVYSVSKRNGYQKQKNNTSGQQSEAGV
jgi:hypothetical protein